jgi:hypothetical protein
MASGTSGSDSEANKQYRIPLLQGPSMSTDTAHKEARSAKMASILSTRDEQPAFTSSLLVTPAFEAAQVMFHQGREAAGVEVPKATRHIVRIADVTAPATEEHLRAVRRCFRDLRKNALAAEEAAVVANQRAGETDLLFGTLLAAHQRTKREAQDTANTLLRLYQQAVTGQLGSQSETELKAAIEEVSRMKEAEAIQNDALQDYQNDLEAAQADKAQAELNMNNAMVMKVAAEGQNEAYRTQIQERDDTIQGQSDEIVKRGREIDAIRQQITDSGMSIDFDKPKPDVPTEEIPLPSTPVLRPKDQEPDWARLTPLQIRLAAIAKRRADEKAAREAKETSDSDKDCKL